MKRNEVFAKIEQIKTELVDNAFPSLFSKEDVQILFEHILDGLGGLEDETTSSTPDNVELYEAIERKINESIESVVDNFDFDDVVELSIGWGKQIEMDIDVKDLRRELRDAVQGVFQEYNEVEEEVVGE
jgi:hypothetical protein